MVAGSTNNCYLSSNMRSSGVALSNTLLKKYCCSDPLIKLTRHSCLLSFRAPVCRLEKIINLLTKILFKLLKNNVFIILVSQLFYSSSPKASCYLALFPLSIFFVFFASLSRIFRSRQVTVTSRLTLLAFPNNIIIVSSNVCVCV